MPPMPIVQAMSFTTVDSGFEQRLATRSRPMFLESLGHQLRSDAPSGIVAGLAQPAPHTAPPAAVQRSFAPAPGSVAPRMTIAEPVGSVAPIDTVGLSNARHVTASAAAAPSRALVEALPPDLPAVPVPVVARTAADNAEDAPERPPRGENDRESDGESDRESDRESDAPTTSMLPLVAQRSVPDEPRPNPPLILPLIPPLPAGEIGRGDQPPPSPGAATGPSRAAHASPPVGRIGEAIQSRPIVQRAVETGAPPSAGPVDSTDQTVVPPASTPAGTSVAPTGVASSSVVGVPSQPGVNADPSTAVTPPEASAADGSATVDLPLVGREPLGATSADTDMSPVEQFPAATTSAATRVPTRRASIGEPLPGGSARPVVQATADSGSPAASIDRVTIPTLGAAPSVLGPSPNAPATVIPASGPSAGTASSPGPTAAHVSTGAAAVARSVQMAPSASASPRTGATVTRSAVTRPLVATGIGEPANADAHGTSRVDIESRPVVARRVSTMTDPVTAVRPVDTAVARGEPSPHGYGHDAPSTRVVELLAARPLSTTFDGVDALANAPSGSSELATNDHSSIPASAPRVSAVPATVQRAVATMQAQRPPPVAFSNPLAVRPATHRPAAFAAPDDRTVVEWAQGAPLPDTRAIVQRDATPDARPSGDAEVATGGSPATTTTAVATVGPAAPASSPAPRSEAELQELCRALYVPLRRRLCRDLLLDRERAGYRTDIRF